MIRLLVVGHAYIVAANRGKLRCLSREADIQLHLVCPEQWPEPELGLRRFEEVDEPFAVHPLRVRGAGHVRRARFRGRDLERVFDRVRPDVVQIEQEPASRMAFQAVRLARRCGARVILFTWDNRPGRHRLPLEWIARYNLARATHILAGNRTAADLLSRRGRGDKTSVLPQIGVEVEATQDAEAARARLGLTGFVVGYVGRLVERKGVHDLLAAFTLLPDAPRLLLVGDGPEREALLARARKAGVDHRVHLVGAVPHARVPEYLAAMSVLVLPSRTTPGWAEQFGHVLALAMAHGVPVVGSDSGAIPEVIGDAGLVFPEGDAKRLAEAIRSLRDDPSKAAALAAMGRARARERFSNHVLAARTAEVVRCAARGGIDPASVRKALVVKPDHLGDLVLALPALAHLRRALPRARIDVLGLPAIHALTLAAGLADRVIPFASPWFDKALPSAREWIALAGLVRRLRRERYDLAVNLRFDMRDILMTGTLGARWAISYRYRGLAPGVSHARRLPSPDLHETERWARLVESAGLDGESSSPSPLPPCGGGGNGLMSDEARAKARRFLAALPPGGPRIAVHAVSRTPAKNWPEARWRTLLAQIVRDLGGSVVLFGAADDRATHRLIALGLPAARVLCAAGRFELAELPALLAAGDAFVGVDSGPAHLAALAGVPSVVLFSRMNRIPQWRPPGDRVTVLQADGPCPQCARRERFRADHACMSAITVEAVRAALDQVLRSERERAR